MSSHVRSLDLSFNGIRHIKSVAHLVNLTDLYFVSNKITVIENLSTLVNITNLELGSNRIRVGIVRLHDNNNHVMPSCTVLTVLTGY